MLAINPISINNRNQSKTQSQPAFQASLTIKKQAIKAAEDAFEHSKPVLVSGFFGKVMSFCKNAKGIYKEFGMDGLKCLKSETFKGITDFEAMSRILSQNVADGTPELAGNIILTQRNLGKTLTGQAKNNLFINYQPYENYKLAYVPVMDETPQTYFPQFLSIDNINRAVCNISNDAEVAFKNSKAIRIDL